MWNYKSRVHQNRRWSALYCALPVALLAFPQSALAALCPATTTPSLVEDFSSVLNMDKRTTLQGWGTGSVSLPVVYTPTLRERKKLHKPVAAATAIDFDSDGDEDIVGVAEWMNCGFEYFENDGFGNFTTTGLIENSLGSGPLAIGNCTGEGAMLRAADVNGDNRAELIFAGLENTPWQGQLKSDAGAGRPIRIYPNLSGLSTEFGDEVWTLRYRDPRWHWGGGAMALTQWNDDTTGTFATTYQRTDILVASSYGSQNTVTLYHACHPTSTSAACPESNVNGWGWNASTLATPQDVPGRMLLIADAGFSTPIASGTAAATPFDNSCAPAVSRGISTVLAEDFDHDGDTDIVLGSMSENSLRYFENTGSNLAPEFVSANAVSFNVGRGVAYAVSGDFNNDGWSDVVVAGDPVGCGGADGRAYLFVNDRRGGFRPNGIPMSDIGTDIDWILKMDADNDGYADVVLGQNDHGASMEVAFMEPSVYFHTEGTAYSKVLSTNDPSTDTIVSATVVDFQATLNGGTVVLYLSNNDGDNWELVTAAELAGTNVHYFNTYGAQLRWKIEMSALQIPLSGSATAAWPATNISPSVANIELSYDAVLEPVRFTRSGLAEGAVTNANGSGRSVLYSASSLFPGFTGTVRTFDIDDCTNANFGGNANRVDTAACVKTNTWSPNELSSILQSKAPGSRTLYTNDGGTLATLSTPLSGLSTNLKNLLGTTSDDDFNFVKNGMQMTGSGAKLYDIGHSTPVFVGPPKGDDSFLDNTGSLGYAAFKSGTAASRTKVLYVAANDGMLHAIDAQSGDELWAYTPANLLGKLQTQRGGDNNYTHDFFIDGPITVRDVFDGIKWRTVLIAGQARGTGRYGANYYTAVDITDPTTPVPLWDFSDAWEPGAQTCDGDICELECSVVSTGEICSRDCGHRGFAVVRTTTANSVGGSHTHLNESYTSYPTDGWIRLDPGTAQEEVLPYGWRTGSTSLYYPSGYTPLFSHSSGTTVELLHPSPYVDDLGQVVMEAEDFRTIARRYTGVEMWPTDSFASPPSPNRNSTAGGNEYIRWEATVSPDDCQTSGNPLNINCGIEVRYLMRLEHAQNWSPRIRGYFRNNSEHSLIIGIDDEFSSMHTNPNSMNFIWAQNNDSDNELVTTTTASALSPNPWQWQAKSTGLEEFQLVMREKHVGIDQIVLYKALGTQPSGSNPLTPTCAETCTDSVTYSLSCTINCTGDVTAEWPECGVGDNEKCCAVPGVTDEYYCAPVGTACGSAPVSVMGETWSPPAVGRFKINGADRWLAIFASGYDNQGYPNTGRAIYGVDMFTGARVAQWDVGDIASGPSNLSTIENTVPGGVALVDMDDCSAGDTGCGYVDRMYVGDLEGRLWKIDTSVDGTTTSGIINNWPSCTLFDAGVQGSGRWWAPIITTPAVAFVGPATNNQPNIYFGTGGDDRAPQSPNGTSGPYRFYSVRDPDPVGSCIGSPKTESDLVSNAYEWIVGDGNELNGDSLTDSTEEGETGDRYWADPVVVNNAVIVMAALNGKIESVDPCNNLTGAGTAYVYAINRILGYAPGAQITKIKPIAKVRQAARVSGVSSLIGDYSDGVARNLSVTSGTLPNIFVQGAVDPTAASGSASAQPPIYEVGQGISIAQSVRSDLRVIRWREIRE